MYNGTVAAIVLQIAHRMNDRRDTISIRLKLAIVQVAAFFSTSFYTIKFVSTFVDFLVPSLLIIELLLSLAQLLQLGSILTWPLFFAPNELILKLTSPWLTMRKLGIIWDLKKLDDKLTRLCPPDTPGPIKRRQLIEGLRDLDMQLYRLVINILDNKKNLEDQLKGKTFPDSIKWSSWETSEAAELHRILGIIPKDQDFDGLVTTLREIATGKV